MKFIAHRGNLEGPNIDKENHPDYIDLALNKGYEVEVDVWKINDKLFLGHDTSQYEIKFEFLLHKNLWIHAKNIEAISYFNQKYYYNLNYFFHDVDACTLTSKGWIWTYPGYPVLNNTAIAVMPEKIKESYNISKAGGICSDYICAFEKDLNFKI